MYAINAGHRIFYTTAGTQGPWVVMSHSLCCDHTMWEPQMEMLARHLNKRSGLVLSGGFDVRQCEPGFPAPNGKEHRRAVVARLVDAQNEIAVVGGRNFLERAALF